MKNSRVIVVIGILVLLLGTNPVLLNADNSTEDFFEFGIPWDLVKKESALDVSFLNTAPAGKNGRIIVKNGVFVEEKTGKRIRFFGANIGADEAFPEKAAADLVAKKMAQAGVNIVRLHHVDNCWSIQYGGSIWDKNRQDRQVFDPKQLDKLEYLISKLKANS